MAGKTIKLSLNGQQIQQTPNVEAQFTRLLVAVAMIASAPKFPRTNIQCFCCYNLLLFEI